MLHTRSRITVVIQLQTKYHHHVYASYRTAALLMQSATNWRRECAPAIQPLGKQWVDLKEALISNRWSKHSRALDDCRRNLHMHLRSHFHSLLWSLWSPLGPARQTFVRVCAKAQSPKHLHSKQHKRNCNDGISVFDRFISPRSLARSWQAIRFCQLARQIKGIHK